MTQRLTPAERDELEQLRNAPAQLAWVRQAIAKYEAQEAAALAEDALRRAQSPLPEMAAHRWKQQQLQLRERYERMHGGARR